MQSVECFLVHALFLPTAVAATVILENPLSQFMPDFDPSVYLTAHLGRVKETGTLSAYEIPTRRIKQLTPTATIRVGAEEVIPVAAIPAGCGNQGHM